VLSVDPTQRRLDASVEERGASRAEGGCPYAPRCPEATDVCRDRDPSPVHINAVTVRCHLYGDGPRRAD
jgi:ABC-type dipeptide/oligopeptide/nickel transport system ATPase component